LFWPFSLKFKIWRTSQQVTVGYAQVLKFDVNSVIKKISERKLKFEENSVLHLLDKNATKTGNC